MAEKIIMRNPSTGLVKQGFIGFSWTTLLFGFWPALFRSDFITFVAGLVIYVIIAVLTFGIGAVIASIVWAFMYNRYYTRKLIDAGYRFADAEPRNRLASAYIGQIDDAILVSQPLSTNSPGAITEK